MSVRRAPSAVLAALLCVPLAAIGVCGAVAPLVLTPASCSIETEPGDCCSRSSSPASPRTPTPDRCAACGAGAFAQPAREQDEAAPTRRDRPSEVVARPATVCARKGAHRAASLVTLSESPPKNVLLATFRNRGAGARAADGPRPSFHPSTHTIRRTP